MMLSTLLVPLAAFFVVAHLGTLAVAWRRCRPGRRVGARTAGRQLPPVTVVRPLCGIETFTDATLAAAFRLDYPTYELLFCVARHDDPIVPRVEAAIAAHPGVPARLLVGDDPISINPKLNNMVKAWREAAYEWIVFIDSNVEVTPDFVRRCVATWREDTGAVSAPPVGSCPGGIGGWLECAFLNTYEARYQYAIDAVGQGFAQGKTLFYRKADLDRSGMRELAAEPAEDAATTKMVRRLGRRVRLAPPSPMPIGVRTVREIWSRQRRWARLRRATFPLEFLPEIFSGVLIPSLVTAGLASSLDWPLALVMPVFLAIWYAAELGLAAACGWPAGWRLAAALVARDLLLPVLYAGAFTGRTYTWKGAAIRMEPRPRRKIEPQVLPREEGA